MVVIRLSRGGAKARPFFNIVVADKRTRRDGRFIERLGFYNPKATGGEKKLELDHARLEYWAKNGAQISDRVAFLAGSAPKTEAPKAIAEANAVFARASALGSVLATHKLPITAPAAVK